MKEEFERKRKLFRAEIEANKLFRKLHSEQLVWEGKCCPSWKDTPAESGHQVKRYPTLAEMDGDYD